MNQRISLDDVRDRLQAVVTTPNDLHYGTCYDNNYLDQYARVYPALWVAGQRLRPMDVGQGWTENGRQHCRVEVVVRAVVQRYTQDSAENIVTLDALHDDVIGALLGWQLPNTRRPFALVETLDGPPHQTVLTCDVIVATETTYRSNV